MIVALRSSVCYPIGMKRCTMPSSLVALTVATLGGAARAEAPTTKPATAAPTTKPATAAAATTKPVAPPPTVKAKIAAQKVVVKTAKKPQSAEDKKRAAQDAEAAGAFANALSSESSFDDPNVGSMGHRRVGANDGGVGALAEPPANTSVRSAATPDVCAEQLIGKPCTRDAMQKPKLTGTTTCAVHAIGDAQLDAVSMQRKIEAAYLAGVRRCAKGKLQGSLVASKTTLSFAVNAKGIVVDVTSAGADKTVADCIANMAASWRFVSAKTAEQAAPRVEVVVETKP